MNHRRLAATTLAVATAAALLAGCGGGSSGGGSKALSRADLDTQANAICAAAEVKREAIPTPSAADIQDATKAAAYFDALDPVITDQTNKLAALKPDADAATDWNAFMAAERQVTSLVSTIRHKADTKDASGLADIQTLAADIPKVETAAAKVGATTCGSSG